MADPATTARMIFRGLSILLLMYGIYFTLTVICLHYLLTTGRNRIVLGYTLTILLVTTIFLAATVKHAELIFIKTAIDPVGTAKLASRLVLLQQVIYSVKLWVVDSLLIYRLWVIWEGNYSITVVPSIFFIGALTSGIAGVALYRHVDQYMQCIHLGVGFIACSVALNVTATSLIAGKLLLQRRAVRDFAEGHGRQYLSILAVFVESGALYSIAGLVYIPLYALNSPLTYVFAVLLEAASGIAPSLILLRIALGVSIEPRARALPVISEIQFGVRKYHTTDGEDLRTFAALNKPGVPSPQQAPSFSINQSAYIEEGSPVERQ